MSEDNYLDKKLGTIYAEMKIVEDNWKQFNKLLSAEVGKTVRSEFVKRLD